MGDELQSCGRASKGQVKSAFRGVRGEGLKEVAESIGEFLSHERSVRGYTWYQDEYSAEKVNSTEHQWFTDRHSVYIEGEQGAVGVESFVTYT